MILLQMTRVLSCMVVKEVLFVFFPFLLLQLFFFFKALMKITCLIKNLTAQKVVKFVILASGTVRTQMDLRYGGNTIQIMTYDLRLTEKILKTFLVGTLQTVEGKGEKKRGVGTEGKREVGDDATVRRPQLFILVVAQWTAAREGLCGHRTNQGWGSVCGKRRFGRGISGTSSIHTCVAALA